jgi:transcriptional regulator with PAS, ATPase and Fis domain
VETALISRPKSLDLQGLELTVIDGPDRGKSLGVSDTTARVGTGPGNGLVLSDPTVSRVHCEVRLTREGVAIVDAGSTNGTFVDGVRVRDAFLVSGSVVRLGGTTLRAVVGEETLRLPLSSKDGFGALIGGSVEMRRVYAVLERVSSTEATVLIQGETGTGKEVVARSIHDASPRSKGPFVAVDCGAIADNLIESELFGHVRGAFSGAVGDREGLFEEAHGGTLFLDEIGELPISLQPKLLRALESRQIRRVGSNSMKPVDVRVVAATNRPLARAVNAGTFREDLYYRLAVVEVALPPLRMRRDDIPFLAVHFVRRFTGKSLPLSEDLMATLLSRSWPGNVRELRNFVEQRVSLGITDAAEARNERPVAPAISAGAAALVPVDLPFEPARDAWMAAFERAYLLAILEKAEGNVTRAAELAGVNRRFVYRLMERLGIEPAGARGE